MRPEGVSSGFALSGGAAQSRLKLQPIVKALARLTRAYPSSQIHELQADPKTKNNQHRNAEASGQLDVLVWERF
jgi:hypothetical protein